MPKNYNGAKTIKSSNGRTGGISLNAYVQMFLTPQNRDCKTGEGKRTGRNGYQNNLNDVVQLWPTPTSSEAYHGSPNARDKSGRLHLSAMVTKMYGTPTANDAKNSLTESQRGRGTLTASIVESLWPTPRAGEMCGGSDNWAQLKSKCAGMDEARKMGAGNGGQLSADWEERLMGYPDKWTDKDTECADTKNKYPAAWLDGSWDTIPRVAVKQNHRRARVKAIGNAIVPQVAAYLWGMVSWDDESARWRPECE